MRIMIRLTLITIMVIPLLGAESQESRIGGPAPNFVLETVGGQGAISLADYRGKVVVLDFWASWCGPCKRSLPELQKLEPQFEDFKVLAINIDEEKENALKFMKQLQLDLMALFDENKTVAALYDVSAMPSAYIIDRQGILRYIHSGYTEAQQDTLEAEIKKLCSN